MSRISTAVRTILLEDPAFLESLSRNEAARLDELFESNRLEPLLFGRLQETEGENRMSVERLARWKMAYVLSKGRSLAYGEALEEVLRVAAGIGSPLRLLRGTHLAFFVYARPELRPLSDLEVQTPPELAAELQYALRIRRFHEMEDLLRDERQGNHCLPRLAREGVTVRIHKRSTPGMDPAPWDGFTDSARHLLRPRLLRTEPLIVLLSHDLASRRYCHSLLALHDLHQVVEILEPSWDDMLHVVQEAGQILETWLALRTLHDVFGSPVDCDLVSELEARSGCDGVRRQLLLKLTRSALLQYPASWRLWKFCGRLLEEARRGAGTVLAAD